MTMKYTKWPWNIPNGHEICIPNGHKIYQHLPLQKPPKFTQILIFGLKLYHLATLVTGSVPADAVAPEIFF
jgi:hypothetical protein